MNSIAVELTAFGLESGAWVRRVGGVTMLVNIYQAITPQPIATARTLFEEYAAALGMELRWLPGANKDQRSY